MFLSLTLPRSCVAAVNKARRAESVQVRLPPPPPRRGLLLSLAAFLDPR